MGSMHAFVGGRIFHGEGSFQGTNLSGEVLHKWNLPEFLGEIFLLSCFLITDSISGMMMLRVIVQFKCLPGLSCLENKAVGRSDFFLEEQPDFPALFKKIKNLI